MHEPNTVSPREVRQRIEYALPGAEVKVETFRGDDHFQAEVTAEQFRGKSLVQQHRLVYEALDGLLGDAMHALALKTKIKE